MPVPGFKPAYANALLDGIFADGFVKLHVGDPGAAGTANAATETTRKALAGTAAGGAISNSGALTWTVLPTADPEDITHFSIWDDLTAGNFVLDGTFTSNPVNDGDTLTVAAGDLDVSLPVAS